MTINAESSDDQRLKLSDEKVREVETARLGLRQCQELPLPSETGIAMGAVQAFHLLLCQYPVESTAGAAIGVSHVDVVVGGPTVPNGPTHRVRNQFRTVVQCRRQAAEIEMRQSVGLDYGDDLAGEGTTGDDQRALHGKMSYSAG